MPNSNARLIAQILLGSVGIMVIFGVLLFLPAGRLDWVAAWVYIAAYLLFLLIYVAWAARNNPEILRERSQVASNTKGWDKLILGLYTVLLLVLFVSIGLDAGRAGHATIPLVFVALGWIGLPLAGLLVFWVIRTNTYASRVARIQEDRGQTVISSGPYRYVRHPMYAGVVVLFLCTPLALGSAWGLLPGALIGILFGVRTALEDRMLARELAGYEQYVKLVRYRLIPGIW